MEKRKLEITQLKNDSMSLMVKFRSALSQKDVDVFKKRSSKDVFWFYFR